MEMTERKTEYISIKDVADILNIDAQTARKLVKNELSGCTIRIGHQYRIDKAGLEKWIEENKGSFALADIAETATE